MLWFVTLTQSCNLSCAYCGSSENFDMEDLSPHPKEMEYPFTTLEALKNDPDAIVCFYGGEPLLKMRHIAKAMKMVPHAKFVLQTNGTLLERLDHESLLKMDAILVSLDGDASRTEKNRGKGTYARVMENVRAVRKAGYRGDLIARMTVSDGSNIAHDVLHLLHCEGGIFDHVHWQLDVLWDSPQFARWQDFLGWRDQSYNPGITHLAHEFQRSLVKSRKILGIAPFLGIIRTHLRGEKITRIRCGAGSTSFNITTGGKITSCPIAPAADAICAFHKDLKPEDVRDKELVDGRCLTCDVFHECGGRCLYANKTNWWGEDGFDAVCVTVKHLLREVREIILPTVRELIDQGVFTRDDFDYPAFNNSIEIIP